MLLRGCDFPDDRHYYPEGHLWFAAEGGGVWRVGVTRFGAALAGDILLFTPKPVGLLLDAGRSFGLLEAGKTVFPVKTPLAAELLAANPALEASAVAINADPYGCWLVRLRIVEAAPADTLLSWAAARGEIERIMDHYAFDDLGAFDPPLSQETDRDY